MSISVEQMTIQEQNPAPKSCWGTPRPQTTPLLLSEVINEEYATKIQNEEIGKIASETQIEEPNVAGSSSSIAPITLKDGMTDEELELYFAGLEQQQQQTKAQQQPTMINQEAEVDTDAQLALSLQQEFDNEYNQSLKREETQQNGKVSLSYKNYLVKDSYYDNYIDNNDEEEDEEDLDEYDYSQRSSILDQARRFGVVQEGEKGYVSKHDSRISSARHNHCMRDFKAVDMGSMRDNSYSVGNKAFNSLKQSDIRLGSRGARLKSKENYATHNNVMDHKTEMLIYKLVASEVLSGLTCQISTGKEAHVFHAEPERAVKVYKTTLNEFRRREEYIKGDYRFKNKRKKAHTSYLIKTWSEKEFANLKRMQKGNVPCPIPYLVRDNVLVMQFIGDSATCPAPKLKELNFTSTNRCYKVFKEVVHNMHKLYHACHLVHADLSEYNILYYKRLVYIIDVGQAVDRGHPKALEFLYRDCKGVLTYFKSRGALSNKCSILDLYKVVVNSASFPTAPAENKTDSELDLLKDLNKQSSDKEGSVEFQFDSIFAFEDYKKKVLESENNNSDGYVVVKVEDDKVTQSFVEENSDDSTTSEQKKDDEEKVTEDTPFDERPSPHQLKEICDKFERINFDKEQQLYLSSSENDYDDDDDDDEAEAEQGTMQNTDVNKQEDGNDNYVIV